MTTITISGLPSVGTIQNTTYFPSETGGVTGRITATSFLNYISSSTLTSLTSGTGTFTGALSSLSFNTGAINAASMSTTGDVSVGGAFTLSNPSASTVTLGNISLIGVASITPQTNVAASLGGTSNWFSALYSATASHNSVTVNSGGLQTGSNLLSSIGSSGSWFSALYAGTATLNTLTINNGGIQPGANAVFNIGSSSSWFNNLYSATATHNTIVLNSGGLQSGANISANIGSSGTWFNNSFVNAGNFNTVTVNSGGIQPGANAVYNIGSSTAWFNNIYGVASHALYADLAEKYTSDADYAPGTVVIFGEETEITISMTANDTRVAGVVSSDPAYLMNGGLEGGVAVALQGRVPCKVIGPVRRGDLMVTSDSPGIAMTNNDPKIGTVIGKALGTHSGEGIGLVEVVVGRI
jgi:hypothetical protein